MMTLQIYSYSNAKPFFFFSQIFWYRSPSFRNSITILCFSIFTINFCLPKILAYIPQYFSSLLKLKFWPHSKHFKFPFETDYQVWLFLMHKVVDQFPEIPCILWSKPPHLNKWKLTQFADYLKVFEWHLSFSENW